MSDDAAAVEESTDEDDDAAPTGYAPDDEVAEGNGLSDLTSDELVERIETLENEVAEKDEEIDDLTDKLSRARADFKNYKKRTKKQQEEMKARATEDLVGELIDVRDNLVRALDQDEDADIRPGVESTLESFDRALEDENVAFILPDPGEEVDPERHEVMQRVDSDQPAGTIADVYQQGYEMGGKILRPARVTVSEE